MIRSGKSSDPDPSRRWHIFGVKPGAWVELLDRSKHEIVKREQPREALVWLFSEFDLHRVFAHVDARNVPARALLTSLGFRQEAELREADWFKGEWSTLCVYAILAEEWPREADE